MSIRSVIDVVNQMQAAGVMESYAIGGAVGATFYLEPVATLDVDIFVSLRPAPGSLIVNPTSLFDYLKDRGGAMSGEYVMISGWPVQFLPPRTPLVEEALKQAVTRDVEGTPARVLSAEHLAAIALQTGRAKDKARLLQFLEADGFPMDRFHAIIERHGLAPAWEKFHRQFLDHTP